VLDTTGTVTASTALRLAKALGTIPQFWLNGQLALDLYQASHDEEELGSWSASSPSPAEVLPALLGTSVQ
jgi:plasmid maintenance system antidote protein VapI